MTELWHKRRHIFTGMGKIMLQAMEAAFQKYAVFRGRSDRSAFEGFFLFQTIVSGVGTIVALILAIGMGMSQIGNHGPDMTQLMLFGLLAAILFLYGLVSFLPSTALIIRRLHDTNRSGWWFWGALIAGLILCGLPSFLLGKFSFPRPIFLMIALLPMYVVTYFVAQPRCDSALVSVPRRSLLSYGMGFASALLSSLCNAIKNPWIRGRISRSEYWSFTALSLPTTITLIIVLINTRYAKPVMDVQTATETTTLVLLFFLVVIRWLSFVMAARRLHDGGYSAWWYLLIFLPINGDLILSYLLFKPSTVGDNRFGPQPQPIL